MIHKNKQLFLIIKDLHGVKYNQNNVKTVTFIYLVFIFNLGFVDSIGTNIHSDEKSKGIIMGLGNEGKYLD